MQKNTISLYALFWVIKSIETVCLMREPISWLHSWYRYRSRDIISDSEHKRHNNYCGHIPFHQWVEAYLSDVRPDYTKVGSQKNFMTDENGEVCIDRVFTYEDLSEIQNYFEEKTGKNIEIPILNVSSEIPYALDTKLEMRLKEHLKKEYEIYNAIGAKGKPKYFKKVDFLVAGTQKGGTTSLDRYLREHKEITLPNKKKELHFFDTNKYFSPKVDLEEQYQWYHEYFSPRFKQTLIGEVTPKYMYEMKATERIYAYNPDMKFILLLRDPTERAYSHWNMERERGNESEDFSTVIRKEFLEITNNIEMKDKQYTYLDRGFYAKQIKNILSYFPKENICVIKSRELKSNPLEKLNDIFTFLGVSSWKICDEISSHKRMYSSPLSDKDRMFLKEVFKKDIELLETSTGMNFDEWL